MMQKRTEDSNPRTDRAWAEIDLGAIAQNIRELRRITAASAVVMAAVKADGYGHGAVEVGKTTLAHGAACLGVASVDEAVMLREGGVNAPILIFGYTPPERVQSLLDYDLTQSVYSAEMAGRLSQAALLLGGRIKMHIKLDTGMGRVGIPVVFHRDHATEMDAKPVIREVKAILALKGCRAEGLYTHFATADHGDKSHAELQFQRFRHLMEQLRRNSLLPPVCHAANSAATIDMPQTHLDMVRPGIAVYGLYPSAEVNTDKAVLKPAMTLKTRVVQLKSVPAGFPVSYGSSHKTRHATTIATVPVGYADGFARRLSSRGQMLVNGVRAPVVGRVCMDMTMLDVGHIPGVCVGDEVVAVGRQKDAAISADEVAETLNTISYEIVSRIGKRVPRIYKH